jgi:adenylyltransferase/sulfurtransferase
MKKQLTKSLIERFSRQIILKDIGTLGQKKILSSKVLVVGLGGLGCPAVEFLTRAGVGNIGIIDNDKVNLSNLHRQSLYQTSDIGKSKVKVVKKKLNKINFNTRIKTYNFRINNNTFKKVLKNYDYIIDGTDNFKTKFLLNDFCLKYKKFLVIGAISKFDGHVFSFEFKTKKTPCLRCFFQDSKPDENILNCETEGILGTIAGIVGTIQANEVLKKILNIGYGLNGSILILNLLNLNFRKVKIIKYKKCICLK